VNQIGPRQQLQGFFWDRPTAPPLMGFFPIVVAGADFYQQYQERLSALANQRGLDG
jgi:hypothetical protein